MARLAADPRLVHPRGVSASRIPPVLRIPLWIVLLAAACASARPPGVPALERGELALAQARWADAETAFRSALAERPGDVRALHGLGRAQLGQGEAEHALVTLDALAARDPGYARVVARRDHARALVAAAELRLVSRPPDPDTALARLDRLDALVAGDPGLDGAADVQELRARALALRADEARARGDLDGAERGYRQALVVAPSRTGPALSLARLLLERGRTDEAVRLLTQTLERHPEDPRVQRLMVDALSRP